MYSPVLSLPKVEVRPPALRPIRPLRFVHVLWAGWLLTMAACVGFFTDLLCRNLVDIPVVDDITTMFEFTVRYREQHTLPGKLALIFARHGMMEHRLGMMKLLILAQLQQIGRIDFYGLAMMGNAFILPLLALLLVVYRRLNRSYLYALPVFLLLFQPQLLPFGMLWCNAAMLYVPVSFFCLLGLWLLVRPGRWALAGAMASLAVALLIFSNALLVMPMMLLVLLVQRRFRALALMAGWQGLLVALYLLDYQKSAATQPPALRNVPLYVRNLLALTGSLLDQGNPLNNSQLYGSMAAGLAVTLVFGWLVWTWWRHDGRSWLNITRFAGLSGRFGRGTGYRPDPQAPLRLFLLSGYLYLFALMLVIALFRVADDGSVGFLFRARYKINAVLLLILSYYTLLLLSPYRYRQVIAVGATLLTGGLLLFSYHWTIPLITYDRHKYQIGATNYQQTGRWQIYDDIPGYETYVQRWTDQAVRAGLYAFPKDAFGRLPARSPQLSRLTTTEQRDAFWITGDTYRVSPAADERICLVAQAGGQVVLVPVLGNRSARRGWPFNGSAFRAGFAGRLPKAYLQPGRLYRLGVYVYRKGVATISYHAQPVRF